MEARLITDEWIRQTRKVICVGPNYRAFREQKGLGVEDAPSLSLKSPESLTTAAHSALPGHMGKIICEVEMAVIIGREARNVSEEEAPSIVAGCALANDITAGDHFGTGWLKMFEGTTPIGPMTAGIDLRDVELELWVNGTLRQADHIRTALFSVPWLIAHISTMMTLMPGDVILTGTPANPHVCEWGDEIELRSPQLGTHRHKLVMEEYKSYIK